MVRSAVRTASFIFMLSVVFKREFDQRSAIITGLLAAVFDDLFDCSLETPRKVRQLVESPATTRCRSQGGFYFRHLYTILLARLPREQGEQLRRVLLRLVRMETLLLGGRSSEDHWAHRGARAFEVFLTVLGIAESSWDPRAILCFGEYLQILDDYEDVATDPAGLNYFHNYPQTDVNRYYLDQVVPILDDLFDRDREDTRGYDAGLFAEFMETYHVFVVDLAANKHAYRGKYATLPSAVSSQHASAGRGDPACLAEEGAPRQRPLEIGGRCRWWPARAWDAMTWYTSRAFASGWQRFLPNSIRLSLTRLIVRCFRRVIPF